MLFAGLARDGVTTACEEDVRTRSTTEDDARSAGVTVTSRDVGEGRAVTLLPGRPARHSWHVPGDPSQAAFFAVLGAIHPDATLEVLSVDASPERVGLRGGASSGWVPTRDLSRAPTDISFCARMSSSLAATEIHASEMPSVDEVPVLGGRGVRRERRERVSLDGRTST